MSDTISIADSLPILDCCCQSLIIGMEINTYTGGALLCGIAAGDPLGFTGPGWYSEAKTISVSCTDSGANLRTVTKDTVADPQWFPLPQTGDPCNFTTTETTIDQPTGAHPCADADGSFETLFPLVSHLGDLVGQAQTYATGAAPATDSVVIAIGDRSVWQAWGTGDGVGQPLISSSTDAPVDESTSDPSAVITSADFRFTRIGNGCTVQIHWDELHYDHTDALVDTVHQSATIIAGSNSSSTIVLPPPADEGGFTHVDLVNFTVIAPYIA